jgi:hypothetical protein
MGKSMSVTFADGTSHTYDDIPDSVTQEQVNTRATTDYPDKQVAGVSVGAHPEAPKLSEPTPGLSPIEQGLGIGQTGFDMANQFLGTPVGHALEIAGGAGYGLNKLKGIANEVGRNMNPNNPYVQNNQIMRNGQPGFNTPVAQGPVRPSGFTGGVNPAFDAALNKAPVPSMLGRLAQGASKAIAPAMIAKELFYTSPEEVQQLKEMSQNGTSLKDVANQKMQQITNAMRLAAARKVIGQ